jgi:hypothetical protein
VHMLLNLKCNVEEKTLNMEHLIIIFILFSTLAFSGFAV